MSRKENRKERSLERQHEIKLKETLIGEIFKHPCIWDKRLVIHRDRDMQDVAWSIVAENMNQEKTHLRKLWKALMDTFRLHLSTINKTKSDGAPFDPNALKSIKWPFFKSLLFMKDVVKTRNSISNTDQLELDSPDSFLLESTESDETNMQATGLLETEIAVSPPLSTSTAPLNASISRDQKRARMKENLLAELSKRLHSVDSEKTSTATEGDSVSRFTQHLADLLRSIPEGRRLLCFRDLSQVCYCYLGGETPVIGLNQAYTDSS